VDSELFDLKTSDRSPIGEGGRFNCVASTVDNGVKKSTHYVAFLRIVYNGSNTLYDYYNDTSSEEHQSVAFHEVESDKYVGTSNFGYLNSPQSEGVVVVRATPTTVTWIRPDLGQVKALATANRVKLGDPTDSFLYSITAGTKKDQREYLIDVTKQSRDNGESIISCELASPDTMAK
jgi:hypothetical protein